MRQAGVWSFRTATGVGRVVDGSLRTRHTLRRLTIGSYSRGDWKTLLQHLALGFGSFSFLGSAGDLVGAVLGGNPAEAISTLSVISLAALAGLIGACCLPFITRSAAVVDIYDITDVTVDADDRELTIQHADDGGDHETTTVEVADEEALSEAVSILQLKGAPVDEALVEKWV